MKLHIGNPATGCNKTIPIDDENKLRAFFDKRIGQEVSLDSVGSEFKGYNVKITGGSDKSGFPMKQGVLTSSRVRLLIPRGSLGFQRWRGRKGERRRKSVRGCIVSSDIAALNLIVTKKGEKDIEGLTTVVKPRTLGPKRASKIRKLFNLKKHQDVRKYVIKHQVTLMKKSHPKMIKRGPKIQRLITPERLLRKRFIHKRTGERKLKSKIARLEYEKLIARKHKQALVSTGKKTEEQESKKTTTQPKAKLVDTKKPVPATGKGNQVVQPKKQAEQPKKQAEQPKKQEQQKVAKQKGATTGTAKKQEQAKK